MTSVKNANQERIKEWVDALRSGEYPQSEKALKTPTGNCCLGVACEIAPDELGHFSDEPHNNADYEKEDSVSFDFVWTSDNGIGGQTEHKENGYLPAPVAVWFQFPAGAIQDPLVLLTDEEYNEADKKEALAYCSEERQGDETRHYMQLTACNDAMGWDFAKIAELVERTYL